MKARTWEQWIVSCSHEGRCDKANTCCLGVRRAFQAALEWSQAALTVLLTYVPFTNFRVGGRAEDKENDKTAVSATEISVSPTTLFSLSVLYCRCLSSVPLFSYLPNLSSYVHPSIRSSQVAISGNCLDSGTTCAMIPSSQMILASNFAVCLSSFPF